MCLRVLMATVLGLTAVIFGTEVWVERRIAVDSYIEPAGAAKKKKVQTINPIMVSLKAPLSCPCCEGFMMTCEW
jgi:hypothetical protein